jgi:DNA primase
VSLTDLHMLNNIQLWVVVALFLFSGASALFKKIQEKRALREIEMRRRAAEEEAMRTGRGGTQPAAPTMATAIDEAQQRRQREQEEIKAQQMEKLRQLRENIARQQGQPTTASAPRQPQQTSQQPQPAGVELWPGGPVVVVNQSGQGPQTPRPAARPASLPQQPRPAATPRPAPAPRPVARPAPRPAPMQPNRQPQPVRASTQRPSNDTAARREAASSAKKSAAAVAARRVTAADEAEVAADVARRYEEQVSAGRVVPSTAAQWRAAFVAAEIFGPPMALRDAGGAAAMPTAPR